MRVNIKNGKITFVKDDSDYKVFVISEPNQLTIIEKGSHFVAMLMKELIEMKLKLRRFEYVTEEFEGALDTLLEKEEKKEPESIAIVDGRTPDLSMDPVVK